jgi:hypothetical protein
MAVLTRHAPESGHSAIGQVRLFGSASIPVIQSVGVIPIPVIKVPASAAWNRTLQLRSLPTTMGGKLMFGGMSAPILIAYSIAIDVELRANSAPTLPALLIKSW